MRKVGQKTNQHKDISFMPMPIPLLAGPGAIAVALGLAAEASRGKTTFIATFENLVAMAIAIIGLDSVD